MLIFINSAGLSRCLRIPSGLIFNSFTATIAGSAMISAAVKKHGGRDFSVDARTARAIFREINRCRSRFPNWSIIEAESSDGSSVNIQL